MYKNMIRTSIFNLTSMDIDILKQLPKGNPFRINEVLRSNPDEVFVRMTDPEVFQRSLRAVAQIKRVILGDTSEGRRPGIFLLVSVSYK